MNSSRLWTIASLLLIVGLLAGTWLIGISPKLAEAAVSESDRTSVVTQNAAHEATLATLAEENENLDELREKLETLRLAVPSDASLAGFIREVESLAGTYGVSVLLSGYDVPVRFAPPADASSNPQFALALGSVTSDNFVIAPVTIEVNGERARVMEFLDAIQKGQRLFLVHDVSFPGGLLAPSSTVKATLAGQMFVLLDEPLPPEGGVAPVEPAVEAEGAAGGSPAQE